MEDYIGRIVRATAGGEKDEIFCVVGVDREQERLLLANGKRRKLANPKRKRPSHVELLPIQESCDHPTIEKLKQGQALTDKELRRVLAAFQAKEV